MRAGRLRRAADAAGLRDVDGDDVRRVPAGAGQQGLGQTAGERSGERARLGPRQGLRRGERHRVRPTDRRGRPRGRVARRGARLVVRAAAGDEPRRVLVPARHPPRPAGRRLYRGVFFGAGRGASGCRGPLVAPVGRAAAGAPTARGRALGGARSRRLGMDGRPVGVPWAVGLAVAAGTMLLSTALWTVDNHYGLWSRIGVLVALAAPIAVDDPVAGGRRSAALGPGARPAEQVLPRPRRPARTPRDRPPHTSTRASCSWSRSAACSPCPGTPSPPAAASAPRWCSACSATSAPSWPRPGSGFLTGWRRCRPPRVQSVLRVADLLGRLRADRAERRARPASTRSWPSSAAATARSPARVLGLTLVALAALWPRADDVHVRNSLVLWTVPPSRPRTISTRARRRPGPSWSAGPAWSPPAWPSPSGDASAGPSRPGRRSTASTRGRGTLTDVLAGGQRARPPHGRHRLPAAARCRGLVPRDRPAQPDAVRLSARVAVRTRRTAAVLAGNLASGRVRYCCWSPSHAGALTPPTSRSTSPRCPSSRRPGRRPS